MLIVREKRRAYIKHRKVYTRTGIKSNIKHHWRSLAMDPDDIDLLDENFEGDGDEEEGVTYKEVEIREQDR